MKPRNFGIGLPVLPTKKPLEFTALAAILITFVIYLGAQLVAALVISIYPQLRGWTSEESIDWLSNSIYAQFFSVVIWGGATIWMVRKAAHRFGLRLENLGLNRPQLRHIWYTLAGFGVYLPLYILSFQIITRIFTSIDTDQAQELGFATEASGFALVLTFISLVIIPPIVEELLCRGFLYKGLRSSFSFVWAMIITSVIFAIAHLQFGNGQPLLWTAAIDTFVLSIVLVYLRVKTNSLWPSIGLHGLKNLLAFIALFVLKQ